MVNIAQYESHRQDHNKTNSWWSYDARGIELRRVCDECEHLLPQLYEPEILGLRGSYEYVVEETIEPESY